MFEQLINIKRANIDDVATLQSLAHQTFRETYALTNTAENIDSYLTEKFSIETLTAELNEPRSCFYLAEVDGDAVGYLKLNFGDAQTELKDAHAIEIERIYVLQNYQGKKIGQRLFQFAISLARKKFADYIWLGVWEENLKAISFYTKNGFVEFDKHVFTLGNDKQTDLMMKLMLSESY